MKSKSNIPYKLTDLLLAVILLNGCGGGGSTSAENGAAPAASARTTPLQAGDTDCPNGGALVESGIDENKNGLLDSEEVDSREKVCNGINSHNSLVTMSDETAGGNCPYGGIRIDSGLDQNDNSTLDVSEIDATSYVCNRIDGSIGWQAANRIETDDTGTANDPQIAFDTDGNAFAVWSQYDGSRYNIQANRYTTGMGWGLAELIETNDASNAVNPQISIDSSGNAVAVWIQSDGSSPDSVYANRYSVGQGWGNAELIETDDAGIVQSPQLGVDDSGNAVAVWTQFDGSRYNIWSNRYLPGFGWGTAELIETGDGQANSPQIAVNHSGNAIAVWTQHDGSRFSTWSNHYVTNVGWGLAELIGAEDNSEYYPQIGIDGNGNAIAVWAQFLSASTRLDIWSNRYTAGNGWGNAELIEVDDTGSGAYPQINVTADGNAVAVWSQDDGSYGSIWSNRYTVGVGWGTVELVEANPGNALYPQIDSDSRSNALVIWMQDDGSNSNNYNIWANRYLLGQGWGNAELIEADAGDANAGQIAIDTNGNALAVWQQSDGTRDNIWSNHWIAP